MPQISTVINGARSNVSPGALTALNRHLNTPFPETILYRGHPGNPQKRFLTLLTGFNSRLTGSKTKKVLKAQKTGFSQTRFLGFSIFSHKDTQRYTKI
jgi:hypothetical protein